MTVVYSEQFQAELCCILGRYCTEDREFGRCFVQTVKTQPGRFIQTRCQTNQRQERAHREIRDGWRAQAEQLGHD